MSFRTDEPFTAAQGIASGLSRRKLGGPDFEAVLRGVYVRAPVRERSLVMARAVLLVHPPTAVVSRSTAARLLHAPLTLDTQEHVTVPAGDGRRRRLGVRCHVEQLAAEETATTRGVRLTSPARLFLDLAAELDLVELVVLGDWMLRERMISLAALTAYCAAANVPQAAHAVRAASYVREAVESPMESRLRMLLVLAGLPEPRINLEIRDDMGIVVMRLDLSYPGVKVAVEYDGRQHADSARQWERDVERRNDLTARGWLLITVTSRGIYRDPQDTIDRVWNALQQRSLRGLRRPTTAWRRHFAV